MGYNKYLEGIRPKTLEGKVVSDADMCEALGVEGILRCYSYNLSKGNVFFDKSIPSETESKSAEVYRNTKNNHSVQHFFDKLLVIPTILMTDSGQTEGFKRQEIMVLFLEQLFKEQEAGEWLEYLENFLERQKNDI